MLDAYSIRKAIPRVVIAVIAINLSIYLCVAALDITTIVGRGLNDLLVSPFLKSDSFSPIGITLESNTENNILGVLGVGGVLAGALIAVLGSVGVVGAAVVSVLGLLLPMILLIAFIALAVLFTLVIRQGLLVFLTIVSPVAIACYILPGTEKYFKQWWDLYVKTLVVYPIIAAIFAMSNVLGSILLNSAGRGGSLVLGNPASMFDQGYRFAQSDAIGTVQIIVAILVLYAPLVLIPFAFKLAGGALATVMNLANGQARKSAGSLGGRIQKNRQDPNTWLGSRRERMHQNRVARGVTSGQIIGATGSGLSSVRRGGSFRKGYAASSSALGNTKAFNEATAIMENNEAFKMISGNDDSLYAFKNGKDAADVERILRARGYDGYGLAQTQALVMRAKNQVGTHAGAIAAVRAQAKTGTAYADNAAMLSDIMEASGGDLNLYGRTLAEARGSAAQSGRIDLGTSSYQTQFDAGVFMANKVDNKGNAFSPEDANAKVLNSVIDSASPAQALFGKPASAKALAGTHATKVQTMQNQQIAAKQAYDQVVAGAKTGQFTQAEVLKAEQTHAQAARDFDQALASAMGLHDAAGQTSPQNARAVADGLFDIEVLDPKTGERTTVFDLGNDPAITANANVAQMRKDFSNQYAAALAIRQEKTKTGSNDSAAAAAAAEAAAAAAAAAAAGGGPPGGVPPNPGAPK